MEISMANVISDETIEYVGILAKLELSDEEKEAAKKDMGRMLDYIDKLGELDTTGVAPMSDVFPVQNLFRSQFVKLVQLDHFAASCKVSRSCSSIRSTSRCLNW